MFPIKIYKKFFFINWQIYFRFLAIEEVLQCAKKVTAYYPVNFRFAPNAERGIRDYQEGIGSRVEGGGVKLLTNFLALKCPPTTSLLTSEVTGLV